MAGGCAIATVLAGCTTTQHEAQRVRLDSARQRAALEPTRVTETNHSVVATRVAEISDAGRAALVVTVSNRGRHAVSDLPISVGYRRADGATVYLNSSTNLGYFESHLPAIRAAHTLTWVYTTARPLPAAAVPFARVGVRPSAPARLTELGVRIDLRFRRATAGDSLAVDLDNPTSVPQYQFQVYAYATRASRYVAAGSATVAELGAGSRDRLKLTLVGRPSNQLHVEAVPTILQ